MKAKLLFLSLSLLVIASCKKKGGNSKPDIELKDVKIQQVISGNLTGTLVDIDIEITDAEGDVRDSVFILKQDAGTPPCPNNTSDQSKQIPVYPSLTKDKVLFRLKFVSRIQQLKDYVTLPGNNCASRAPDTSRFIIWVKDKAGNLSDTVTTNRIGL
jgi:hypothetical protein